MRSSPQADGAGAGPVPETFPLVLELSVSHGDPLSGTVGISGGPHTVAFHGWIDLMSAINTLRDDADETG